LPGALSLRLKRQECKGDHSSPSSAEVNPWSYASTPSHVSIEWYLNKHRNNFALPLPVIILHNYLLEDLLWSDRSCLAGQCIGQPCCYGTRSFVAVFPKAPFWAL
jgi:hypothetical protein